MGRKFRKGMVKKIVAILCILVLLQSYISSLAYVVKAMDMTMNGTTNQSQDDEIVVGEKTDSNNETENEPTPDNEIVVGGEDSEIEEPSQPGNEEEPSDNDVVIGEPSEEPEENPSEDDNQNDGELNGEENQEPDDITIGEEPIIEEYVEPEASVTVTSENTSIYKGYLYANATSDLRYATNYNTIDVVTITGGKFMSSMTVQDDSDRIGLITNTKIGLSNDMFYRQTRISVEEFENILGVNGSIAVYNPDGVVIDYINYETPIENGEYVYTYPYQMNTVRFELTNIINDGTISIKNDKAIKETSLFSREQISLFSSINTVSNINVYANNEVRGYRGEGNITLEETESKMTFEIDNDTLSVEETNEIAINVTLKTDEERFDLFENPTIDLEFPTPVQEINVTGINLLYKNGLSLDGWNVYTDAIGKKVLRVSLAGSQLEYTPGSVGEGTTIVVYATVDVDRLTSNSSEALKMTYTNKDTIRKSYMLEGKDSEDIILNLVGRQEMIKASRATIPNVGTEVSYDDDIKKIQVEAENPNEQTVILTGSVVNNFETTAQKVSIIGRIPFVGNKDGNGNDLNSTFNTTLSNSIATSGVVADVYYSEKEDALKDDSSWTQDITDISKYKSYKIVIKDGNMAKGESLSFEYSVNVPANVGYNAKAYSTYTVYYSLDEQEFFGICSIGIVTEEREITIDDIEDNSKEQIATLTVGTQVSQGGTILNEGDTVYERQILRYTVVVKNDSNVTATNVKIRGNAENSNLYYLKTIEQYDYYGHDVYYSGEYGEDTESEKEYEEFTIDSLSPGESKIFEFQAIVLENVSETYGKINVTADNIEETNVETIKIPVKEALLEVRSGYGMGESLMEGEIDSLSGSEFQLYGYVKNISEGKLNNVKLSILIPQELEYKNTFEIYGADDLEHYIEKSGDNTIITFEIPSLKNDEERQIYVSTVIREFDYLINSKVIILKSIASVGDNSYISNDYKKQINQGNTKIDYTWKSDVQKETVENGEQITFELTLSNVGLINSHMINIKSNLPSGLILTSLKVINNGNENEINFKDNNKINESLIIKTKEDAKIIFVGKVDEIFFDRDQSTIDIKASITGSDCNIDTDVISYKINNKNITVQNKPIVNEPIINDNIDNVDNNQNSQEPNNASNTNIQSEVKSIEKTYNISGKVWLDKNKDGINRDEKGINAVVVMLYGASSEGGIDVSNKVATVATSEDGTYNFAGVKAGNYVVAFSYDTSLYKATKYQVKNATSSENSDVVSKSVTFDGNTQILGLTDVLTVSNASLVDIDMGLVSKNEFDLALNKYISSVTVKNKEGTKTYEYGENSTNEKLEIRSKYYKSSKLDITYKFVVTNEGEISGYVNKLVDYLPSGTTVDLDANEGWYYGDDGNLYYNGLVGKEIQPGRTEEVKLTLTKSLEDGEALMLKNAGEISEYTNALGFEDIDSVTNNKEIKEDDYGSTLLVVSISTGNIVVNIVLIVIILICISMIVILVIKNKDTKKIYK